MPPLTHSCMPHPTTVVGIHRTCRACTPQLVGGPPPTWLPSAEQQNAREKRRPRAPIKKCSMLVCRRCAVLKNHIYHSINEEAKVLALIVGGWSSLSSLYSRKITNLEFVGKSPWSPICHRMKVENIFSHMHTYVVNDITCEQYAQKQTYEH